MQSDPKQRTGTDNMVLRRIFIEVFQRGQCSRNFLYLIKDQQRIVRVDLSTRIQFQAHDQTVRIQIRCKQLCHSGIRVKVNINRICISLPAKFFHQPGLAYLSCPFDDQRLAALTFFPLQQFFYRDPVHRRTSVLFLCVHYNTGSQKLQRTLLDNSHFLHGYLH